MKPLIGAVVVSMVLSGVVFAAESGQEQAEQQTKEGQAQPTVPQNASASSSTASQTSTPLPPGLQKQGKVPHGLEKQGKTPRGWSQGKASWKQSGQTTPAPQHSSVGQHRGWSQNHPLGSSGSSHAAHGHH